MADITSTNPTTERTPESGSEPIRPSDIHAVWKEACQTAGIQIQGCSWNILDAIYHGTTASFEIVSEVLKEEVRNVEYYFAKTGRDQAFDCDNAAFMLRERVNKKVLSKRLTTSLCFGIAVLRAKSLDLAKQDADLIGAPDEHVVNWLISADNSGKLKLRLVMVSDPGEHGTTMQVTTSRGPVDVKVPVLDLQDFAKVANLTYGSVQMIVV